LQGIGHFSPENSGRDECSDVRQPGHADYAAGLSET
jgi:hypothetical protein